MLGPSEYFFVKITDVSEGGLGVMSDRNVQSGAALRIATQIPSSDFKKPPVQAMIEGKVTHSVFTREGCKLGIQITRIDPDHHALIRHWVQRA